MYLRCEFIGDEMLIYIPDTVVWCLKVNPYEAQSGDVYGVYKLYLEVDGKEILLRDADYWCSGRKLPAEAVGELYSEIIDIVFQKVIKDDTLKYVDIDEIESELLNTKYEKLWIEKGYIELDANGSW